MHIELKASENESKLFEYSEIEYGFFATVFLPLVLLLSFSSSIAESAIQTDWSGGYTVYGPVSEWGKSFYDCELDYGLYQPGRLSLARSEIDINYVWATPMSRVQDLDLFDIDEDGNGEIFVQQEEGEVFVIDEIASPDSFILRSISPELSFPLCFADVNSDGLCDVIGAGNQIVWAQNPGSWELEWPLHAIGTSSELTLDAGDIDGDGDLDVVGGFGTVPDGEVWWWRNEDGAGTSWSPISTDSYAGPYNICITDIDADGDEDIYYSNGGWYYSVRWLENESGDGLDWTDYYISTISYDGIALAVADFDHDGDQDPASAFAGSCCYMVWFRNPGSGSYWNSSWIPDDYYYTTEMHSEDMDCDGDFDILAQYDLKSSDSYSLDLFDCLDHTGLNWEWINLPLDIYNFGIYTIGDVTADGIPEIVHVYQTGSYLVAASLGEEYSPTGYMESSRLYLGCDPDWGTISWEAEIPESTSVGFQVRASDNVYSMGNWSEILYAPSDLSSILADTASYFQYRVLLNTDDPLVTPVLHSVEVTWNPAGNIPEVGANHSWTATVQSPSSGGVNVILDSEKVTQTEILIYDLSGRLACRWSGISAAGYSTVFLETPCNGLHLVRIDHGGDEVISRAVVIP